MKIHFGLFIFLSFFLNACGDGDFRVNPSEGTLSSVGGGSGGSTALDFFTTKLYPLMIANTGNKGCLGSGCHSIPQSTQTFFQVDAASVSNSFNWASARRTTVTVGTYAASTSDTIKNRKNQNHQNFSNWTAAEKALVDEWSALP